MSVYLIPVIIIFEINIPDGAAILHERRGHIADSLDGSNIGALQILVDILLLHTGKESVEAVFVGCLIGRSQPDITD
jgi:hypothetical protein